MKKAIVTGWLLVLLVFSLSLQCSAEPVNDFSYNILSANLYCNDLQIDLSKFPLIDISDEITEGGVTYASSSLLDIYEILGIYYGHDTSFMWFCTKEYLEKFGLWISRAEFEAEILYITGEYDHKGLYYDNKLRRLHYAEDPSLNDKLYVVSCGENYYVFSGGLFSNSAYFNSRNISNIYYKIFDRKVDKSHFKEYDVGFSSVPVTYPNTNKDFSFDSDLEYGIVRKTKLEIYKGDEIRKKNHWMYGLSNVNGSEEIDANNLYVPLEVVYETIGYAVISDAEKQNYFIYSEDYLKENPDWKSVDKLRNMFTLLGNLSGKNATLRYDDNEDILYFESEAESVGVPAAAFGENAYVRVADAIEAYKKIANIDESLNDALSSFLSSF
jgi:hypothetical protein